MPPFCGLLTLPRDGHRAHDELISKDGGMPRLRIALAQVNAVVGDLESNSERILEYVTKAQTAGANVVAFPELALTGYPVEDLVFREAFVAASRQRLSELGTKLSERGLGEMVVVVGYLDADGPTTAGALAERHAGPRNTAATLHRGAVVSRYFKHHLPNYGVFDEDRHFVPGHTMPILRLQLPDGDLDMCVVICEDIWQIGGPISSAAAAQVGLVMCINASPYEQNKDDVRLALCERRAAEAGAPLAYVNMVGGQDDLVFDGDSLVVTPRGEVLGRATQFDEDLLVVDVDGRAALTDVTGQLGPMTVERLSIDLTSRPTHAAEPPTRTEPDSLERLGDDAEIWQALTLGLRDYVRKNGFESVILGISGGIDSALVAVLACDAIGAAAVHGVALPSVYSSPHSLSDAEELAERTGLRYRVVPIAPIVDEFLGTLKLTGLAEENLQARIRGVTLMGLSNAEGHLVLATGNKTEYAVGYSTLYGDAVGGFAPIKDVYKTLVWRLAKWRNEEAKRRGEKPPIPENSITKPPSAELRPDQLDSDSLPDYPTLDAILARYIDGDAGRDILLREGYDPTIIDKVIRLVDGAEYKRRQSAPGTKITLKSFGRDRRLPITNRWREH